MQCQKFEESIKADHHLFRLIFLKYFISSTGVNICISFITILQECKKFALFCPSFTAGQLSWELGLMAWLIVRSEVRPLQRNTRFSQVSPKSILCYNRERNGIPLYGRMPNSATGHWQPNQGKHKNNHLKH